ncbi:DUF1360 domain-containing protein [Nonomuraea sp. NPDC048826]|uniref:DUF1360 domain-containing protein n=1 Tax=Nonomuraea sp. NPDC048826 TaxID=3364347 RepID=UPI0037216BA6
MTEFLEKTEQEYEGEHDRPLGTYVRIIGVYGTVVAAAAVVAKLTGRRPPERISLLDVGLMAASTNKLARLLAKDPVTSPIRAPFTRFEGVSGPSELKEEPRNTLGELVSCPFCIAQWVATGYAIGLVFAPRATRLAGAALTAVAASDWLQLAHTKMVQST